MRRFVALGLEALDREDPLAAVQAFGAARELIPDDVDAIVGSGRAELSIGFAERARQRAEIALALRKDDDAALALMVRALIRDRRFTDAVRTGSDAVAREIAGVETLAAHASALYRVQRNDEAAATYAQVLEFDPLHEEAHVRLGSGLTAPRTFTPSPLLRAGIGALRDGRHADALLAFRGELDADPTNPVAHRLVGETLFAVRTARALASNSENFAKVLRLATVGAVDEDLAGEFMPQFATLSAPRRAVALRTLALFHRHLPQLVQKGARHDLLAEDERTTDDPSRAALRARRTFDGRVWDDVRGVGGLRAATGVEALDEAASAGFDTLAHEIAHQVHLHVLRDHPAFAQIKELHSRAVGSGHALDYYAASNWAEYFGQGVEAFVALCKRPAAEATHGHTRFELMRLDPELHGLIASLVDADPLSDERDPALRDELLLACIGAALEVGRVEDARTAAALLADAASREAAFARAAIVEAQLGLPR